MNNIIYIVEDDTSISTLLKDYMNKYGFEAVIVENFNNIMEEFDKISPSVVLLDVNLPKFDGFYWCTKIRQKSNVPIIFISARDSGMDQIRALESGADDYITKPFSPKEVALRVKIQLTKNMMINNSNHDRYEKITEPPFEIDEEKMEVKKNGKQVDLKPKEYKMFLYMIKHKNQIISKERFCDEVWGEDFIGFDNTIMVHIRKLREKLEKNPSKPEYILNVKGLGYKLQIKDK